METKSKKKTGKKGAIFFIVLLVLIIFSAFVMFVNSRKPDLLVVTAPDTKIKGSAFTRTNQILIEQLYTNWLPNDLFWPTIFLDNMPNFQIGVLEVVRYNIRVMRDNLTRMRTTDKLDPAVEKAFTAVSNDPLKWWFPSAEDRWKLAHENMETYYRNLSTNGSHFYPRADNLSELFAQYVSLMGGVNTRLINAPRDMPAVLPMQEDMDNAIETPKMVDVDIPWHLIDDNFYYAQGVAYALHASLEAVKIDFKDVLIDKNSVELLEKILEDLRRCDFEPIIVFNGDLDSIFANHSLNLSGIFNDARQKMDSLIVALQKG